MEPQPGSPASPPSPGTSSSSSPNSAEVPAPDETVEAEQQPARKSTSSSSSSSSSDSSTESLRDVDVVDLGDTLLPAPEDKQAAAAALPEPSADEGKPDGGVAPVEGPAAPLVETTAGTKQPDDQAAAGPAAHGADVKLEDEQAKPEDWATTWPEEAPPPAVDYSFSSDGSAGASAAPAAAAQVQTMLPAPESGGTGSGEFDPERIPASVFQPRTSMSQAEWSMTSNESLFSIQGADVVGGPPYAGSRSHFDFFYDEAMAAAAVESEASAKLPSVAEGTEPAAESSSSSSREFKVPGSAGSQSSDNANKAAAVYRRNDSGSGGSSSNFSFAFPILAPTSPKKKEHASSALYQPLEKGWEPQRPVATQMEPPESAFVEMTTEAERRGSTEGCCCCGCCWFDCSWATCCGWWRFCSCACPCCCCSCPSFCRCSWCLCS
ncbi:unnamed protein product [Urochloa humidicola]